MLTDGWPVTAALDPVTGNPDVQYTSDEHAAILAGLIVRDIDGAPRAGVLPRHTNSLVTARPDMKVDVAPFEAVLVNAGIRMIALTEQLTLDVAAAQVANTRYDIVYVEVTDRALTGVKSTSAVKVATGQPGPIPADPSVPAGAVRLARLTIAANATATNAGVSITAIHQFTAPTMGVILFRTLDEMRAWTPPRGQLGRLINSRGVWEYDGTLWRPTFNTVMEYSTLVPVLPNGESTVLANAPTLLTAYSSSFASEFLTPRAGGWTVAMEGLYQLIATGSATVGGNPQSLNHRAFADVTIGGRTQRVNLYGAPGEDKVVGAPIVARCSNGSLITINNYQISGAARTWAVAWDVVYLGPLA